MRNKCLKLKFNNSEKEYIFENKVFVIEDKKLSSILSKTNIKNEDSPLMISSMNINISEVFQLKINVENTGYFLANFSKESFTEEKREKIISRIKELKDGKAPTPASTLNKIRNLLNIINEYKPIYVSFVNNGDLKVDTNKLATIDLSFPLLVIKNKNESNTKRTKKGIHFKLFVFDYLFISIFTALLTFGTTVGLFEINKKENTGYFLLSLAFVFALILISCVYFSLYKKGKVIARGLRYYLLVFIVIGLLIGLVSAYFISLNVVKVEHDSFNKNRWLLLSILISFIASASSIYTCRLFKIFHKD